MGEVKPWQVIVMVAATVAVAASAWFTFRSNPDLPKNVTDVVMVDVNTGELFTFDVSGRRGVTVPDTNPGTKRVNLVPVFQTDSGGWSMATQDFAALSQVQDEIKINLDRKSGVITGLTGEIKKGH